MKLKKKKKFLNYFKLKKELTTMYFVRFSVVKLTLLSNKMFLYIENERSTSTEVIGICIFIQVAISFKSNP